MDKQKLKGKTILVVEPDLFTALDLQDEFVGAGATVYTAYCMDRALAVTRMAELSGVIADKSVSGVGTLKEIADERGVPLVVYDRRNSIGTPMLVDAIAELSRGRSAKRSTEAVGAVAIAATARLARPPG